MKGRRLQAERLPHAKPSECGFHDRKGNGSILGRYDIPSEISEYPIRLEPGILYFVYTNR